MIRKSRKHTSRFAFWSKVLLFVISALPAVILVFPLGRQMLRGEDRRWMIRRQEVAGLFAEKPGEATGERWKANVEENPWQYIIIHHSATQSGSVESIHEEHRRRRDSQGNVWLGIGYHFVIGNGQGMKDGRVESTFRWKEQVHGAHSGNALFNSRGIGICLIGDFEKSPPTKSQIRAVQELVRVLALRHGINRKNLIGHSSVKATACPGKYFPMTELRKVIPEFPAKGS